MVPLLIHLPLELPPMDSGFYRISARLFLGIRSTFFNDLTTAEICGFGCGFFYIEYQLSSEHYI